MAMAMAIAMAFVGLSFGLSCWLVSWVCLVGQLVGLSKICLLCNWIPIPAPRRHDKTLEPLGSRCCMNHASNCTYDEWIAINAFLFGEDHGTMLSESVRAIARLSGQDAVYHNAICGGDYVIFEGRIGQHVHSDNRCTKCPSLQQQSDLQYIAVSFAVEDVEHAPLAFLGKGCMERWVGQECPGVMVDGALESPLVYMKRGDVFFRNPYVWHAGTAHSGGEGSRTRYLPACQLCLATQ